MVYDSDRYDDVKNAWASHTRARARPCARTHTHTHTLHSTGLSKHCLTVVFLVFSDRGCCGQKCNVTRLCCNGSGKRGLDHACGSSSCSDQHSACNCSPMLFVLM